MRATIKDIASNTGFSVTTVSLVLNNKGDRFPETTRKVIMEAAKELKYYPNQVAVGLVKKRTKTIGLIVSDVSNEFFSKLAKGVENESRKRGWNVILCNTNDIHERDLEYIQILANKGIDGVLFCMSLDSDVIKAQESVALLNQLKIPFIMIDRFIESSEISYITTNHEQGGYVATEYLLKNGHKRIGCVTGPAQLADSKNRLMGYKKALEEYGIDFDSKLIYEGNYSYQCGSDAVEYLAKQEVTAIFAFNDMSAYGVYRGLKEKGYAIPEDVSIMGYDDIFFSKILDVPLTTIRQPIYEMGVEAVRQLMNEIKSDNKIYTVINFQPLLIKRKSVGRPR